MRTNSIVVSGVMMCLLAISSSWAQVPGIINYQGRVVANGANFNGTGQFKFALVNGAGNVSHWSNDGSSAGGSQPTAAISLTVTKGVYSALLGDTSLPNMTIAIPAIVFTNADVRLRVWFNDGVSGFQQLSPDQRIGAVGYALIAANVDPTSDVQGRRLNIGTAHTLTGTYATIAGGSNNTANDTFATVSGGAGNTASAPGAFVGGGGVDGIVVEGNTASGGGSVVVGGDHNTASAGFATVGGGSFNLAGGGSHPTVGGGSGNTATNDFATVSGGHVNTASGVGDTVGGGQNNKAGGGIFSGEYATVAGGRDNTANGDYATAAGGLDNAATGVESTVGGGYGNIASNDAATVSGGDQNVAGGLGSFVGGGFENTASGLYAAAGGGQYNSAIGDNSTVGGGLSNTASSTGATVPGGTNNTASGKLSFAAGQGARATNDGAFVWADLSSSTPFVSTSNNQFNVRAAGGVRFFATSAANVGVQLAPGANAWSPASDRNVKENFKPVDVRGVLEKVSQMPVTEWNLITQDPSIRHIGPMAQDFKKAFGVGEDDKHISTTDEDGVALAAIQGLYQELREEKARNAKLEQRLDELERRVGK